MSTGAKYSASQVYGGFLQQSMITLPEPEVTLATDTGN